MRVPPQGSSNLIGHSHQISSHGKPPGKMSFSGGPEQHKQYLNGRQGNWTQDFTRGGYNGKPNIKGSLAELCPPTTTMCVRNINHLRCGHRSRGFLFHCTAATINPLTGRRNKCSAKTTKINVPKDGLCGKREICHLSACEGRWICCRCRFGYRPGEVNRIPTCVFGGCSHGICWGCYPRTAECIQAMYAEEGNSSSEEVSIATSEDTSEDSIVFSDEVDDEDVGEQ
jgi:hypothetical protein